MAHIINKVIENHIFSCTPSSTDLAAFLALLNRKVGCSNDFEMEKTNSGILLPKPIVQAGSSIIVPDNTLILQSANIELISFESLLLSILENVKSKEELLHIVRAMTGDLEKISFLICNDFFEGVSKTRELNNADFLATRFTQDYYDNSFAKNACNYK